MAPEQAAADPKADHRVDLYAIGFVGYEMLLGSPPFFGRTPQAVLAAQLTEMPAPLAARRYDVRVALRQDAAQGNPRRSVTGESSCGMSDTSKLSPRRSEAANRLSTDHQR